MERPGDAPFSVLSRATLLPAPDSFGRLRPLGDGSGDLAAVSPIRTAAGLGGAPQPWPGHPSPGIRGGQGHLALWMT